MRRQDALAERWETSGRFTAPPRRHPTKAGFLAALDMGIRPSQIESTAIASGLCDSLA